MSEINHTFVICAYKESPYLEACIQSLQAQTVPSRILMVTSTPNPWIEECSKKYGIPLEINTGEKGITQDWNFAYHKAETEFITIAHQDDVYLPKYTEHVLGRLKEAKRPLIAFTDYGELREEKVELRNQLLKIKRLMLFPLRGKVFSRSRFVRRRILSMGCPICCPSVTFARKNLPAKIFRSGFRSDEDWEAWERLSREQGDFIYVNEVLMYHRIHEGSETTAILEDCARSKEDYVMFCKFWPKAIAKILVKMYAKSENSNQL